MKKLLGKLALLAGFLLGSAISVSGHPARAFYEGAYEHPRVPEFVADLADVQPPDLEQSATANLSITVNPASGGTCPAGISCSLGWFDLANTTLNGVPNGSTTGSEPTLCPQYSDIAGSGPCENVMTAWGGGVADTTRNHMITWGGGHSDYHGNEVYDVDLSVSPPIRVLARDASHGSNLVEDGCSGGGCTNEDVNPDGTPTSRHTYAGEVYAPNVDEIFMFGGSVMYNGGFVGTIWELNPSTFAWTNTGQSISNDGDNFLAAYDSANGLIYTYDNNSPAFQSYNPTNNTVSNLTLTSTLGGALCGSGSGGGNNWNVDIDPVAGVFYCVGDGGGFKINISTGVPAQLTMSGCPAASSAPGFAYYPVRQDFVLWSGGNTVYIYNQTTDSCTSQTFTGGPGAQQTHGTNGRLRYFPALGTFILGNSMDQDFFALRLDDYPDASFQYRAHQPGVLDVQGFDTSAIFSTIVNTSTPTDGFSNSSSTWVLDTTNFVSGGGSAHCPIAANFGDDNPCEDYWAMFGQGANLVNKGTSSTFYVQFAFRADASWVNTNWTNFGPAGDNTAPKLVIFDNVQSSCDVTEITTHYHDSLIPASYTDCGGQSVTTEDGTTWNDDGDYWQSGWLSPAPFTGYQCSDVSVPEFSGPNCFKPTPNQWYTFYFKVVIGSSWTAATSTIDAYVAPYGTQLKQMESVTNYNFGGNDNTCNAAGTGTGSLPCDFNNLHLTQFMTDHGIGPGGSPAANVWYDELIISSNPIPSSCLWGCSQPQ